MWFDSTAHHDYLTYTKYMPAEPPVSIGVVAGEIHPKALHDWLIVIFQGTQVERGFAVNEDAKSSNLFPGAL